MRRWRVVSCERVDTHLDEIDLIDGNVECLIFRIVFVFFHVTGRSSRLQNSCVLLFGATTPMYAITKSIVRQI